MESTLQFLDGGLAVMCIAIGVLFLRYWHIQRERLFLWFTFAFFALSGGWGIHVVHSSVENAPSGYLFRLVAFSLIMVGIVDKNRAASRNDRRR